MAEENKNIFPEEAPHPETPGKEQAEPAKTEEPVAEHPAPEMTDTSAAEHPAPEVPEATTAEHVTPAEKTEPAPKATEQEQKIEQAAIPGMEEPAPAAKVIDFTPTKKQPAKETAQPEGKAEKAKEAAKSKRGRPPKAEKTAAEKPKQPRDKMSQSKKPVDKGATVTQAAAPEAPAPTEPEQPPAPRDATRSAEPEQIVYINLSELHPFKNHPFGVRDDNEMKGLVESVRASGVNQPALVRPREDGGYEIVAGHRRQKASELAGFANMPCIVRNMTDDEAILAMTDDNLRHREKILPTEKANSLKMQVEAIKHQGGPGLGEDAGKRSTEIVGERNGMNYKQVQRYIRLTELVPDLQKMLDEKKLAFTPAVEISFIRPKHQRYIAVSIEGQQSTPSLSQAQQLRKLDKDGKLNPDVIDGILSQEKKKEDRSVIINSAELEKYFGKDKSPREMKDQILSLLDDWKAKQPPELAKPQKKNEKAL